MPYWMIAIYPPGALTMVAIPRLKRWEAEHLANFIKSKNPSFRVETIAHA